MEILDASDFLSRVLSPFPWHPVAGADVLFLCVLRGENGINFPPPEGFQKAEIEQMNNIKRISRVLGVCAKILFSRMSALLPARSGLWAWFPSTPCALLLGECGGRV